MTRRCRAVPPGLPWRGAVLLGACAGALAQIPPPPDSPPPVVDFEYDAMGKITKSIRARGQAGFDFVTRHDYDSLSRRLTTTDARGKTTGFGYNGREDLTQVIDPRGLVTQYPRNGLGDPQGVNSPDTGNAGHTVDAVGHLSTRTDSRGVRATYDYDALNRWTSVTYAQPGQPDEVFIWNYDQTGAGFSYGLGRLTSTQFPAGTATYAYDALGRLVSTTQTVTSGTTVSLSTGYGYDAAGHVTRITYPSGRVLTVPYAGGQPAGMSLAANSEAAALTLISALDFEPGPGEPGAARSWNWQLDGGTLAHTRVFDLYGRMIRYPLGGAVRDVSYDAANRITAYTHWDAATGAAVAALNQGFAYDELGRLVSVTSAVGNWTIGYDDNGNRMSVSSVAPGNPAVTRTYAGSSVSNWLLGLDNPTRTMNYDAAGNVVIDAEGGRAMTFTIDPSGRVGGLIVTTGGAGQDHAEADYAYDNFGQRVLKKDMSVQVCSGPAAAAGLCNRVPDGQGNWGGPLPGPVPAPTRRCHGGELPSGLAPHVCDLPAPVAAGAGVVFVYDQAGHLLGEYGLQDGVVIREYVWLRDIPVAIVDGTPDNPVIYYLQTDHLDTPRVALDRSGRQRWSWVAEPFGNSSPNEDPLGFGGLRINLRMPGQYFDIESGLAYNWNRSYDASVGRYTQSDPIGLNGGVNTYAYVGGNPISKTDPRGLDNPGMGPYGGGSGGSSCSCKSFGQRAWDRYRDTSRTIDSAIDSVLPWPINSATGLAGAAGGGFAARDYGGRTALQEGARLFSQWNSSDFSLFRSVGRPDIVRVGATSFTTAVAVGVAWNGGLLIGSGLYEGLSGGGCD